VRGSAKKRKLGSVGRPPAKLAFRPQNYKDLLELIPPCHRAKPTPQLQGSTSSTSPTTAPCAHPLDPCQGLPSISRHKDSNWIVVRKPLPVENGNPYVAMDSTNVFVLQRRRVCPLLRGNAEVLRRRIQQHVCQGRTSQKSSGGQGDKGMAFLRADPAYYKAQEVRESASVGAAGVGCVSKEVRVRECPRRWVLAVIEKQHLKKGCG